MDKPIITPAPRPDVGARAPGTRSVRPRDAATLIIVRRDAEKPRREGPASEPQYDEGDEDASDQCRRQRQNWRAQNQIHPISNNL